MSVFAAKTSLVLHTEEPDWAPENTGNILRQLQRINLAAEKLPGEEQAYLVGEKFLELVTFMGCSPSISFTPGAETEAFSYIRLTTTDTIRALTGKHSHAPLCPHCNKAEKNWREKLTNISLHCSACGQTTEPWLYNWRRSAGFGRFFIEITEIYPQEAIPQPGLLTMLEPISQQPWKYFYHCP